MLFCCYFRIEYNEQLRFQKLQSLHSSLALTILQAYNVTIWQSDNLTNLQYHNITISQSHNLTTYNITILQSHNLTISQSHNLTISQSHNVTILQACEKGFNIILTNLTQYLLFEMDSNADLKGSFSQLQLVCLSPSREVVTHCC